MDETWTERIRREYDEALQNRPRRSGLSRVAGLTGFVFVVALVLGLLGLAIMFSSVLLGPCRSGMAIAQKTMDADNVIYNYEWFKRRYEDVGAIDEKIKAAEAQEARYIERLGDRDQSYAETTEAARLGSVTAGLQMQRADLVAEYNAKARMVNRKIFMMGDSLLPERIP